MSPWIGRVESSSALDGLTPVSSVPVTDSADPRTRWDPVQAAAARTIASWADGGDEVRVLLRICGLIG